MLNYTVVGGNGFIGTSISESLRSLGHNVWIPKKGCVEVIDKPNNIIIYCAGNGDCDNNSLKVFEANLNYLVEILQAGNFKKLIYLSSTRLYMGQKSSSEDCELTIRSSDTRRLFNLTKLTAEEMLLKSCKNIAIVRPSNVYGVALSSPLFLPAITRNAINHGVVDMYVSKDYAKDYVAVEDVAEMVINISLSESLSHQIYNIASGSNTTASEIAEVLQSETGCKVNWHKSSVDEQFPVTDISRIQKEFNFKPRMVLSDLRSMVDNFKANIQHG